METLAQTIQGITNKIEDAVAKTKELESAANGAGGAFGGLGDSIDENNEKLDETLNKINKINQKKINLSIQEDIAAGPSSLGKSETAWVVGSGKLTNDFSGVGFKKYHTGTEYVSKNSTDDYYAKEFDLKPDEVIRILKVGEAVIPKNDNLKRIKESSNFEDNVINKTMKISKTSQTYSNDDNSNIIISIGDTIVQGNADENIIGKLNEYKKSIVSEVFSRINKHTNLSGFRSVKRYV